MLNTFIFFFIQLLFLHIANRLPDLELNTGFLDSRLLHDSQPLPLSGVSAEETQLQSYSAVPKALPF